MGKTDEKRIKLTLGQRIHNMLEWIDESFRGTLGKLALRRVSLRLEWEPHAGTRPAEPTRILRQNGVRVVGSWSRWRVDGNKKYLHCWCWVARSQHRWADYVLSADQTGYTMRGKTHPANANVHAGQRPASTAKTWGKTAKARDPVQRIFDWFGELTA